MKDESFLDFAYVKKMDLGEKFNMSYRIRCLLNENIDLSSYGHSIKKIMISPLIGSFQEPRSVYGRRNRKLTVEFDISPQKALDCDERQFFKLMITRFLEAIAEMERPKGFNFQQFKKDVEALRFEQLPVNV